MLGEISPNLVQGARFKKVITVEKTQDFSGCMSKTLNDSLWVASIGLAAPIFHVLLVLANNIRAFIARASVYYYQLETRVILIDNRPQSQLQILCLIEGCDNYADSGQCRHYTEHLLEKLIARERNDSE